MGGPVTCSKSAMVAAANTSPDDTSNTRSGNTARDVVLHPAGGLLSLPPEIRLEICSYITISPVYPDSVTNRGILMACRQLEQDMFDEHGAKDLDAYVNASERPWISHPRNTLSVKLGQPLASTRFIRSMTLRMSPANLAPIRPRIRRGSSIVSKGRCVDALEHLYSLYLDRLQVMFEYKLPRGEDRPATKDEANNDDKSEHEADSDNEAGTDIEAGASAHDADTPQSEASYDDEHYPTVKSLDSSLFLDFVRDGKVNCRAVVFTIHELSSADGGRDRSTTLDMSDEKTGLSYTMTIVQDKEERQVEREFISKTRFKRGAL